jgi:hypothetical protein
VLPVAVNIDETILDASYAKEFWKISLAENTVGRRSDISEDLCDQMID